MMDNRRSLGPSASGKPVMLCVIGVAAMLLGIILALYATQFPLVPADAATLTPDEIKDGMGLSIAEAVLLDEYATSGTNGRTDAHHCAVSFGVSGGQTVVASLEVPMNGPLFETMWAYLNDEDAYFGDCTLTLCATTQSLNEKLAEFLRDYVKSTFGPLTPYRVAPVSLIMRGETPEAYAASVSRERNLCLLGGVVLILCGAAVLIAFFRKRG